MWEKCSTLLLSLLLHNCCAVWLSIREVSSSQYALYTVQYSVTGALVFFTSITVYSTWTENNTAAEEVCVVPPSTGQSALLQPSERRHPAGGATSPYMVRGVTAVGGTSHPIGSTGVHHLRSIANELTSSIQSKYREWSIAARNPRVTYLNLFIFISI